jgi:hypothetical protein
MSTQDIPKAVNPVEPDQVPTRRKLGRPFEKGNGGRKPGSQNRTTRIAAALMDGHCSELVETGRTLALAGNIPMLKLFLERILPKEPAIHLDLPPLRTAADAVATLAIIARKVAEGEISPSQGADLASITDRFTRALDVTNLLKRMADLEEAMKAGMP